MKTKTRYKQTEVGKIPEDWEIKKLEEVSNVFPGYPFSSFNYTNSGTKVVRGENLSERRFRWDKTKCWKDISNYTDFLLQENDVLVAMDGNVGINKTVVRKTDLPLILAQRVSRIRARKGLKQAFLNHVILSDLFKRYCDSIKTGTTISHISSKQIEEFLILLPSISEQEQIAGTLSSLDDKIELNREMNKTLEEIGKALFKRWFVDFEFPNDDDKPYKSNGGRMVDSELGEIPKGWEVKTLRQLVEYYVGGGWGSEQQNENHTIEAAVVRGTDIPAIKMGSYSSIPIRFHKESNYKSRVLEEGDIVFEVSGGSTDQPVGRSSLIMDGLQSQYNNKPICASFCKLIRPVKDLGYLLQPSFELLYSTDEIYKYQEKSTGITNYKFEFFLDDYKLTLPLTPFLITQYISFSKSLNDRRSALAVESENLKKIRDSLLPRLMSGKLRVN